MSDETSLSPCPFCGGSDLLTGSWSIDEPHELIETGDQSEIDSIECARCLGSAPRQIWNQRSAGFLGDTQTQVVGDETR